MTAESHDTSAVALDTPLDLLHAELTSRLEKCQLELPPLPQIAAEVLAMTSDERSSSATLSALIHRDQALAGLVLRYANSAALGGTTPIVSLQQAVARLGLLFLGQVVFAVAVKNGVYRVPGFRSETRDLWQHALLSGLFAKEIARSRRRSVETAFLCGLLHNVGRPILLKAAVDFSQRRRLTIPRSDLLNLVEQLHTKAAALVAIKWSLPRAVLESITYAATRQGARMFPDEARASLLASLLARHALTPNQLDEATLRTEPAIAELNLYRDDIDALLGRKEDFLALSELTP